MRIVFLFIIIALFIISITVGITIGEDIGSKRVTKYFEERVTEIDIFLTRNEINNIIKNNIDSYFHIYADISGSEEIANIIITKALEYDIPINIAFGLGKKESRFDPEAINQNYSSQDRGLFQLNSRYYTPKNWRDPVENTDISMSILKENYEEYGLWEFAILTYNVGSVISTGPRSTKYLGDILKTEIELDESFNEIFRNLYISEIRNR